MKNAHLFHRLGDVEFMGKALAEGMQIQDVLEYTHEDMDGFYQIGCELFTEGSYKEASDVFFFLIFLNNTYDTIWYSYGLSEQRQENHQEAISAFFSAIFNNPTWVEPYLQACYSCAQIEEYSIMLYLILLLEENVKDLEPYQEKIEAFRKMIEEENDA